MNQLYIWKDGAVEELPSYRTLDDETEEGLNLRQGYVGCFIYDMGTGNPEWRYGTLKVKTDDEIPTWKYVPKEHFPKEFLVHLLLMGIA